MNEETNGEGAREVHSDGFEEEIGPQPAGSGGALAYDEKSDIYTASGSQLGEAMEELGVRLGTVLVLKDDFVPTSRKRTYECFFAKNNLPAGASRKIHMNMVKRVAETSRRGNPVSNPHIVGPVDQSVASPTATSSTNAHPTPTTTNWRSATPTDLSSGHNDQWLRDPRHMPSRLRVGCPVKVAVELPLFSTGVVRIQVSDETHNHPAGDYLDTELGCQAQYTARGKPGNLCLPVRPALKQAFSIYREANKSASYGTLASLSLAR